MANFNIGNWQHFQFKLNILFSIFFYRNDQEVRDGDTTVTDADR